MASPHVAGVAALVLSSPIGADDLYPYNGVWDPSEVENRLEHTAQNLGNDSGWDLNYGYGIVNAALAVVAP